MLRQSGCPLDIVSPLLNLRTLVWCKDDITHKAKEVYDFFVMHVMHLVFTLQLFFNNTEFDMLINNHF